MVKIPNKPFKESTRDSHEQNQEEQGTSSNGMNVLEMPNQQHRHDILGGQSLTIGSDGRSGRSVSDEYLLGQSIRNGTDLNRRVQETSQAEKIDRVQIAYSALQNEIYSLKQSIKLSFTFVKGKLQEQFPTLEAAVTDAIDIDHQMKRISLTESVNKEGFDSIAGDAKITGLRYFIKRRNAEKQLEEYTNAAKKEKEFLTECIKHARNLEDAIKEVEMQQEWLATHHPRYIRYAKTIERNPDNNPMNDHNIYQKDNEQCQRFKIAMLQTMSDIFRPGRLGDNVASFSNYPSRIEAYRTEVSDSATLLDKGLEDIRNIRDRRDTLRLRDEYDKIRFTPGFIVIRDSSKVASLDEQAEYALSEIRFAYTIEARRPHKENLALALQGIRALQGTPPNYRQ